MRVTPYSNANGTFRPDIVLYINGLPLVLIECKSPKLKWAKQLPDGIRQFRRYKFNYSLRYYKSTVIEWL
ncbi:hypothetical protein LIT32_25925 (plasmid) [Bacillus sp. CMF21]|nr:hypothetical protein LIT32_25925 [Bacillus sp. CMF21]